MPRLQADISNATNDDVLLNVLDRPITGFNDTMYGFMTIKGIINESDTIPEGVNANISTYPYSKCSFDSLIPENYYCISVVKGDNDEFFELGEVVKIRFKLKGQNALPANEVYRFLFIITSVGRKDFSPFVEGISPRVISSQNIQLR